MTGIDDIDDVLGELEASGVIGASKKKGKKPVAKPGAGNPATEGMTQEEIDHAPSSWLTPEQLANVNRALTSDEQKIVDAHQIRQAEAARTSEEAKGGPTATATITRQGGVIVSQPASSTAPVAAATSPGGMWGAPWGARSSSDAFFSRMLGPLPLYGWGLIGLGSAGLVTGLILLLRRGSGSK